MKLLWSERVWAHYLYWQGADVATLVRINELLRDIMRQPFTGLGKPEPLKGDLKGYWSRRITGEHRLVYRVEGSGEAQCVMVAMCRYHY
ncbi:MAG: Txe/YoeB family addiction module toxin [Rhodospirillaceae bacterium]|nr:Txe/YoeB family addiction module toxin [Rhodospirillales bacterium]